MPAMPMMLKMMEVVREVKMVMPVRMRAVMTAMMFTGPCGRG